ncbi:MAG TPA: hypothetical protein VFN44_02710, partial [Solirubrobacteraceae bacterium]|nr:hypothetical protein [Solirubrobacteraceae bacterium]
PGRGIDFRRVWAPVLDRFSHGCTVSIQLIDSERPTAMLFFAVAAADSRRLTRTLALSALPKARTIR